MRPEWREAAVRGAVAGLAAMVEAGADLDARDGHGQTALMLAAASGHARAVEWLAARGAALDLTAKHGLSALMLAALRGHADVARVLVRAGASRTLRATGAGFAGQTAEALARAAGHAEVIAAFGPEAGAPAPPPLPFVTVESWTAAAALVAFVPHVPRDLAGAGLRGLRVFLRDHRGRELPPSRRLLEAHYDGWSISQALYTVEEARRLALDTSYGVSPTAVAIAGRQGRAFASAPAPPEDVDGPLPAVVVWHDGPRWFHLSSLALPPARLIAIGASLAPLRD